MTPGNFGTGGAGPTSLYILYTYFGSKARANTAGIQASPMHGNRVYIIPGIEVTGDGKANSLDTECRHRRERAGPDWPRRRATGACIGHAYRRPGQGARP